MAFPHVFIAILNLPRGENRCPLTQRSHVCPASPHKICIIQINNATIELETGFTCNRIQLEAGFTFDHSMFAKVIAVRTNDGLEPNVTRLSLINALSCLLPERFS